MSRIKQFVKAHIGISNLQEETKRLNCVLDELKQIVQNDTDIIRDLITQNKALEDKTNMLKKEINVLKNENITIKNEVQTSKNKINVSEKMSDELKSNIDTQKNEIKELKTQFNAQNTNIKKIENKNLIEHRNMRYDIYKYMDADKYEIALSDWYYRRQGKHLDLKHPKTYNEIVQWSKLYDMDSDKVRLVDKYLVREWVKERLGDKYLIPLLGVWKTAEEIDFRALPDKFVLKCNHGCGYNIIVQDKTILNEADVRKKLNDWLHEDFAFRNGFEMQYSKIERCIIAEEYVENNNEDLYDYKVFCFNGKAHYIMFLSNRKHGLKMQIYDLDWNLQPFVYDYEKNEELIERPDNLLELIECAEKLAKDFIQVRVDFYRLNSGEWKFGEMTFSSASGGARWEPEEYDKILGELISLPEGYMNKKVRGLM